MWGNRSTSACLIVGGTGALGMAAAVWLAQSGCTALCLAGRRGRLPEALAAAMCTEPLARVAVTVIMCDAAAVADGTALTAGA